MGWGMAGETALLHDDTSLVDGATAASDAMPATYSYDQENHGQIAQSCDAVPIRDIAWQ